MITFIGKELFIRFTVHVHIFCERLAVFVCSSFPLVLRVGCGI